MSKKRNKNLLICATPLQILIAEKISLLHPNEDFYLVLTKNKYDDPFKYQYYFNKLNPQCIDSMFWEFEPNLKNLLKFKSKWKKSPLNIKYNKIFVCNIERRHFQYIISQNRKAKIFTLDDGVGNITGSSIQLSNHAPKNWKKLVWKALGISLFTPDIRSLSQKHYTIYKDLPNIINRTEYINIFSLDTDLNPLLDKNSNTVKFFLGQPLNRIYNKFNYFYISQVLEGLNIDFYFPHPAESICPLGSFKNISTNLIFEEYIVDFLKENRSINVELYSFYSSSLINLSFTTNRIEKLIYVYDEILEKKLSDFYYLSEKKFGIQLLKL